MLEIRNLTKVYRSKTGEQVRALDNVSVSFPESGMVFILGKSGSGKSTLLNIMGGLDSYDSGEFIIKGKSSKSFVGSDFDAYRNTFIGFIFQEYNILDDFTVGANIALALELQGKKATPDRINGILSQVDLLNYAKRKPNELSGGQKQRVAIARALVKEPQIIMADEPTGALDSNTGKQIFDSLKKLSQEKLVLIVSHDRDFAEKYADRIIELADGKIISDVTKHERESQKLSAGVDMVSPQILRIKGGYKLTEEDLKMINEYLSHNTDDVILSSDGRVNSELRSAVGISEQGNMSVFEGTDNEKDIKLKTYEKKDSKFIRSRLPMKNAVRMGSSGLKHKKFRLVMTILLSLISFVLFGFADTMAAYNKINATTESMLDSNVKNASIQLKLRHTTRYSDGDSYTYFYDAQMNDQDIEWLHQQTGLDFIPVYTGNMNGGYYGGFNISTNMQSYSSNTVYTGKIHGIVDLDAASIAKLGFNVTGRLPEKQGEIAITELMYRQFQEYGFINSDFEENVAAGTLTMDAGGSQNSIIGKHISFTGMYGMLGDKNDNSYEIVGVVDTQFDYNRYQSFLPTDSTNNVDGNMIADMVLQMEIQSELGYGYHGLAFMNGQDIEKIANMTNMMYQQLATHMSGWSSQMQLMLMWNAGDEENIDEREARYYQVADSSVISKLDITWFDGVSRDTLAANEIILPSYFIDNLASSNATAKIDDKAIVSEAAKLYGKANWDATNADSNYYQRLCEAAARKYISDCVQNEVIVASVKEYAEWNYGEILLSAYDVKDFWARCWFEYGSYDLPITNWDLVDQYGLKYRSDVESEVGKDIAPFILDMYGIDNVEVVNMNNMYRFYECLYNTSEANPEFNIESWYIGDMLRYIHSSADVNNNKLWENNDFIQLMKNHKDYSFEQDMWDEMSEDERIYRAIDFYQYYYIGNSDYGYESNEFGTYSGKELEDMAQDIFMELTGDSVQEKLATVSFKTVSYSYETQQDSDIKTYDFKIVGTYDMQSANHTEMVISDTLMADYKTWYEEEREANMEGDYYFEEEIAEHEDGIWAFALAPLGTDRNVVLKLVEMSYDENVDLKFSLQNPIMDTLGTFNDFIEIGSKIFLYVGIAFAIFSSLLLMNFIATSISYKKREIGILRAVGARSSDVFKIFFSEAFIIAMINFILSTAVVIAGIIFVNNWMHSNGINITILTYGVRQFALMLALSVGVAFLSSFLPVNNIARRKPVDAIKDK